jgi:hypothetical protein
MNSIDNQLMSSIGGKVPSKISVELGVCLTILTLISCAVGFFLNVSTAFKTVIRHRQQCRLRIISLLGLVFSDLLFFIPIVILLLIDFDFDRIKCDCKAHAIVAGLSAHALFLLLNMTLALIDRYMTASSVDQQPDETKSKANSRSSSLTCVAVAIIILSLMLLILILVKLIFFVEIGNLILHCETWLVCVNIVSTVLLVLLFASCTFLNWMVYKQVNQHVLGNETRSSNSPYSTQAGAAVVDTTNAVEWIELVDMEIKSQIDRQLQNKQNTIYFVDDV